MNVVLNPVGVFSGWRGMKWRGSSIGSDGLELDVVELL